VTKAQEYRLRAAKAKEMAEKCQEGFIRALWFQVADNWLRMIPKSERPSKEQAS
jgi:hypothetical protein